MSLTLFFLRFFGPLFIIVGCSILFYPKQYGRLIKDLQEFSLAYYLSAIIPLMLGLGMVLIHNGWNTAEEMIVSAIGWLTLLKGVIRLLTPHANRAMVRAFTAQHRMVAAIIIVLLGAWISWIGFM